MNENIVGKTSEYFGTKVTSSKVNASFIVPIFAYILYVLLDNTVPTATITYANQRDSLLTIAGSNPDSSY